MDADTVYLPLDALTAAEEGASPPRPASLLAIVRATGATRWTVPVATRLPPLLAPGVAIVATPAGLEALDVRDGRRAWSVALDRPVRGRMIAAAPLLLALLEGDELAAVHLDRREVVWRRSIGEAGPVSMTADAEAAYLATAAGRVVRVRLADGSIDWERRLEGELSEPTVDRGRLFVGSDAYLGSLWSLETGSGADVWVWNGRVFGGAVVGTAVVGDTVYVASKDNVIRALRRGTGVQRWKQAAGTRPLHPPTVFAGVVAVAGVAPSLSTFHADTGAAVATWSKPADALDALLEGPPLLDDPAPFEVGIVLVFRSGQVIGLRPTAMLFREPPLAPLPALPGRGLPREPQPER